jgi:hypothetical protein
VIVNDRPSLSSEATITSSVQLKKKEKNNTGRGSQGVEAKTNLLAVNRQS